MKKVESRHLLVGRSYYANDDTTTPLTFVKYDQDGYSCFTQPKGGYWVEQTDGLCHFGGNPIFYEIEPELKATELTLQEKFEQGWEIRHKNSNAQVEDLHIMKNGKICVAWGNNSAGIYPDAKNFEDYHTITPPAPKVEKMFTPIFFSSIGVCRKNHFESLEDAKKAVTFSTTCIIEHEKQGDKWVFVKAHNI